MPKLSFALQGSIEVPNSESIPIPILHWMRFLICSNGILRTHPLAALTARSAR